MIIIIDINLIKAVCVIIIIDINEVKAVSLIILNKKCR